MTISASNRMCATISNPGPTDPRFSASPGPAAIDAGRLAVTRLIHPQTDISDFFRITVRTSQ
jgi:hypothetical protein